MKPIYMSTLFRSALAAVVLFLYAAYFALVATKTPFDFSDPEFAGTLSSQAQVNMVLANEPTDHLRTGAACLLLGLLIGSALGTRHASGRKGLAIALLLASGLVIASTFVGITALATPLLLWAVAIHGIFVAVKELKGRAS